MKNCIACFSHLSLSLFFLGCFIVSSTACKRPGFSVWYHKLQSLLLSLLCLLYSRFLFKKSQLGVASYHQQATNYVKSFLAIDVRLSDFCFNHISLSCVQKGNEWVSGSTILRSKDAILQTCDKYLILKPFSIKVNLLFF